MDQGIFVGLIYNAALLLMMGIIFDSIALTTVRYKYLAKLLSGISLGLVAIAIMSKPWVTSPGVVFDTRSILLSLVALFFSFTPTAIVSLIAIIYRIWQGGAGALMGISVIISSVVWGMVWKKYQSRWKNPYGFRELYTLGILTHISMLAMTLFLPAEMRGNVFKSIALPVIIIYPIVTVFLGQIMARRVLRGQEAHALEASEQNYRGLYDKAPIAYQSLDNAGNYLAVNQVWLDSMGYTKDEVIGHNFAEFLRPDFRSHFAQNFPNFKARGSIDGVEFTMLTKAGAEILVSYNGVIIYNDDGSFKQTQCIFKDITLVRKHEAALRSIEWMLTKKEVDKEKYATYEDLTKLNTNRLIMDSVGKEVLEEIVRDYLLLMDTSAAIYEKNGDYALGLFSSSWCSFLDAKSRALCDTDDNRIALDSGKWLCHESWWRLKPVKLQTTSVMGGCGFALFQ
jgi:PAS domain S-box-containing protein